MKTFSPLIVASIALFISTPAAADYFTFTDYVGTDIVSGSFYGTLMSDNNTITSLHDVTVTDTVLGISIANVGTSGINSEDTGVSPAWTGSAANAFATLDGTSGNFKFSNIVTDQYFEVFPTLTQVSNGISYLNNGTITTVTGFSAINHGPSSVPLPPSVLMFVAGLLGFGTFRKRVQA